MNRAGGVIVLITVVAGWTAMSATAGDWPQRRGPGNDGRSSETEWSHAWPLEGPKVKWKAEVGTGFSSFAAGAGRVFTLGNAGDNDTVHCLDAATGAVVWTAAYAEALNPKMYEGGPNATPTLDGGRLVTVSKTGRVICWDAAAGGVLWSNSLASVVSAKNGNWGVGASPLVVGDRLLVNYGSALVALDRADGRVLWKTAEEKKGEYSFATPVVPSADGGRTAIVLMNQSVFSVGLEDGRVLWKKAFGSGYRTHSADPVLVPGGVFLSSGDDGGELLALKGSEATRRWKNKNLSSHTGSPLLVGSHLYGIDAGGYKQGQQRLRCVELEGGKVLWEQDGVGNGSLLAAGDRLIVLSEGGELLVVAAKPERAEVLARAQVLGGKCWTQPVLSGGLLYCRNAKGNVVCLDLRAPGA